MADTAIQVACVLITCVLITCVMSHVSCLLIQGLAYEYISHTSIYVGDRGMLQGLCPHSDALVNVSHRDALVNVSHSPSDRASEDTLDTRQ